MALTSAPTVNGTYTYDQTIDGQTNREVRIIQVDVSTQEARVQYQGAPSGGHIWVYWRNLSEINWQDKFKKLEENHQSLQKRIFDKAYEMQEDEEWCDGGLRAALVDVGIDVTKYESLAAPEESSFQDFDIITVSGYAVYAVKFYRGNWSFMRPDEVTRNLNYEQIKARFGQYAGGKNWVAKLQHIKRKSVDDGQFEFQV